MQKKISEVLNFSDIVLVDARSEKVGKKFEMQRWQKSLHAHIGEKEVKEGLVSVRKRGEGDLGTMSIDKFRV